MKQIKMIFCCAVCLMCFVGVSFRVQVCAEMSEEALQEVQSLINKSIDELSLHSKAEIAYTVTFPADMKETVPEYISAYQGAIFEGVECLKLVTPEMSAEYVFREGKTTAKVFMYFENFIPKSKSYEENIEKVLVGITPDMQNITKTYQILKNVKTQGFKYCENAFTKYSTCAFSTILDCPPCMPDMILESKEGICLGYSNLFSVLCDKLSIPCIKMRGVCDNTSHEWNLVYLSKDGVLDWYCVDLTYCLGSSKSYKNSVFTLEEAKKRGYSWNKQQVAMTCNLYESSHYNYFCKFTDISNHWCANSVLMLNKQNLVSGYSDNTYRPDMLMTKGDFLSLALRVLKEYKWETDFSYDSDSIFSAISTENFDSTAILTREELAYILVILAQQKMELPDLDVTLTDYESYMVVCQSLGLLKGDSNGQLNSLGAVSRGMAAVVLERLINL